MDKSKVLKIVGAVTLAVAAIGGIVFMAIKVKNYFDDMDADFIDDIDDEEVFDVMYFLYE